MGFYKIKITLMGTDPEIHRVVAVPKDSSFQDFHHIVQAAMGWQDYHLNEFRIPSRKLRMRAARGCTDFPAVDGGFAAIFGAGDALDAAGVPLSEHEGEIIEYLYDFGDRWIHRIEFLGDVDAKNDRAKVLEYVGECPPEDSGGIQGYYWKLEVMADKSHPEHRDVTSWMRMMRRRHDINVANAALRKLDRAKLAGETRPGRNG